KNEITERTNNLQSKLIESLAFFIPILSSSIFPLNAEEIICVFLENLITERPQQRSSLSNAAGLVALEYVTFHIRDY
ncbi:hypothetical protein GIB67_016703, partial [Kingdonia uniflora]